MPIRTSSRTRRRALDDTVRQPINAVAVDDCKGIEVGEEVSGVVEEVTG